MNSKSTRVSVNISSNYLSIFIAWVCVCVYTRTCVPFRHAAGRARAHQLWHYLFCYIIQSPNNVKLEITRGLPCVSSVFPSKKKSKTMGFPAALCPHTHTRTHIGQWLITFLPVINVYVAVVCWSFYFIFFFSFLRFDDGRKLPKGKVPYGATDANTDLSPCVCVQRCMVYERKQQQRIISNTRNLSSGKCGRCYLYNASSSKIGSRFVPLAHLCRPVQPLSHFLLPLRQFNFHLDAITTHIGARASLRLHGPTSESIQSNRGAHWRSSMFCASSRFR